SKAFMAAVRDEAKACFRAGGIPWEEEDAFQGRVRAARGETALPPGQRNLGSTWQSLLRGSSSVETDYLNGEIVRLGRLHGIPTPHNEILQEVANAMVAADERPGRYTAQDLEEMVRQRPAGAR
ncbi:MAG TPA: ketopantoate reductase C-terminal domain-containing protein, partial [Chloroflexota bacterium]|nr:ketopantoate reductase C-terminal domain-containing protein [Chloroflexota bacterium]